MAKETEELLAKYLNRLLTEGHVEESVNDFLLVSYGEYYVQFLDYSEGEDSLIYSEAVSNQMIPGLLSESQALQLRALGFEAPEEWQSGTNFSRYFNATGEESVAEIARISAAIMHDIFGLEPESLPEFQLVLDDAEAS